MNPVVLVFADWFTPGQKAGGLITALSNLTDFIGDAFDLRIFTRDRDLNDERPYNNAAIGEWQAVGRARVFYASDLSLRNIRKRILEVMPDVIYLNSFFSTMVVKTLLLRKLGLLPKCAFVLAPRGELSPAALKIKSSKKTMYRNCALRAGLYRGLVWQASSELEQAHIVRALRSTNDGSPCIAVASDLPSRDWLSATHQKTKNPKSIGGRFVFISRISPIKNLLFALDAVAELKGQVQFDIFGPIDDPDYWKACEVRMRSLPGNVVVRYRGMIPRTSIPQTASGYDFFLLPTQGENFGYVILEAMAAGCPVVVSDQTPWRDLAERGVGWVLPLQDRELWARVLQQCVDLEPVTYASMSSRSRQFVEAWARSASRCEQTVELFNLALRDSSKSRRGDSLPASFDCRANSATSTERDAKGIF